jgi:hypothetical protein
VLIVFKPALEGNGLYYLCRLLCGIPSIAIIAIESHEEGEPSQEGRAKNQRGQWQKNFSRE